MDKQRLEINLDDLESNSVDVPIDVDDENGGSCGIDQQLKRERKLTSKVWKSFDILSLGPDKKQRARCKLCRVEYFADSKYGTEFDDMSSDELSNSMQKSQLELYLDEPRMARNIKLDVLAFWKSNQFRYPELAAMARDILSIPVSTVAYEASFSVGGRVLDQYRTSLKPDTVEINMKMTWIMLLKMSSR